MIRDDKVQHGLKVVSIKLNHEAPLLSESQIQCPEDAIKLLGIYLHDMDREMVCVVNLNGQNKPINCSLVSIGTLNSSLVHPREIMKSAILSNAARILLLHNHPSGSLQPSNEDIEVTNKIEAVCNIMDIPLLDHIIVSTTPGKYLSIKDYKEESLENRMNHSVHR